jgi:conjugative relaxase-like TrwC/TraI family protein
VSLAHALAKPDTSAAVLAAHEAAVAATLGVLEREAAWVRLGRGGTERVRASGIVAARFTHRLSRACEAHLHTHVAIANLAQGPCGRWRSSTRARCCASGS